MSDISIRKTGRTGRITLTRPKALNALSYDMCMEIDAALKAWADDDDVAMLVIDAEGEKAFCAGGDIQEMYDTGKAGDFDYGRRFWRDEYRMNARMFEFPKPVASFLQGFTMGGGVGVGCHGSHRVVGESAQIAMPECGIGLVPDVGGSLILSRAPGRLGEYLGLTGARMGPGDAVLAGFADYYIPEADWPALITALEETGDWNRIDKAASTPPPAPLEEIQGDIDATFGGETLRDILNALDASDTEFASKARKMIGRNSPLSMGCTVQMIHRLRGPAATIRRALETEYRFTYRAMEHGDFIEGIRAAIIDKDRNPTWSDDLYDLKGLRVSQMLMPLGRDALTFEEETS
ncbi:enoyl-CoA hydratase/isomerase family protein [Primorskyibacter aestuariivivens]|uniref:enoyl-CoA hydratase/isomerase family protein n=1 Tax=Primorskyibacter aestuariivivens TaxID=1888912 RepID=UPI002300F621|nr:enoyl-CoA hydratase/isomerase family protein [Primorskyibacter aestuariivivens]MDA7426873.1 enoyl-CoA hydratase/isomerase family protein [Primorskyibacter aestuariivivens]